MFRRFLTVTLKDLICAPIACNLRHVVPVTLQYRYRSIDMKKLGWEQKGSQPRQSSLRDEAMEVARCVRL